MVEPLVPEPQLPPPDPELVVVPGSYSPNRGRGFIALVALIPTAVLLLGVLAILSASMHWETVLDSSFGRASKGDPCPDSESRLIRAATEGDLIGVDGELDRGLAPDATDAAGNTALGCSIVRSRVAVAKRLLERGADPNHDTGRGARLQVPLALALRTGQSEIATALLDHGADPDREDCSGVVFAAAVRGEVALSVTSSPQSIPPEAAAIIGSNGSLPSLPPGFVFPGQARSVDLVGLMLDHGADPDGTVDRNGHREVPLMVAIQRQDQALIARLLELGADPDGADDSVPLQRAVLLSDLATATLLLDRGADPDGRGRDVPLAAAFASGNRNLIELLLTRGADPQGREGARPLVAIAQGGNGADFDRLIDLGADPNTPVGGDDPNRVIDAALDVAAGRGELAMVRKLLDLGASPTHPAPNTVVLGAAVSGAVDQAALLDELIEAGADPNLGTLPRTTLDRLRARTSSTGAFAGGRRVVPGDPRVSGTGAPGGIDGLDGSGQVGSIDETGQPVPFTTPGDEGFTTLGANGTAAALERLAAAAGMGPIQLDALGVPIEGGPSTTAAPTVVPSDDRLAGCPPVGPTSSASSFATDDVIDTLGSLARPPLAGPRDGDGGSVDVTPLTLVAALGDAAAAQRLLAAGADPERLSVGGVTPMELARLACADAVVAVLGGDAAPGSASLTAPAGAC